MGEEKNLFFRGADAKKRKGKEVLNGNWAITKDDGDFEETSTSSESLTAKSENSVASSASDMADDASSSSSNSLESSSCSSGPLYELSELLVHLPVKRGLSKHYEGKSQSFTSLANAKSWRFGEEGGSSVTNEEEDEIMQEPRRGFRGSEMESSNGKPWLEKLRGNPVICVQERRRVVVWTREAIDHLLFLSKTTVGDCKM